MGEWLSCCLSLSLARFLEWMDGWMDPPADPPYYTLALVSMNYVCIFTPLSLPATMHCVASIHPSTVASLISLCHSPDASLHGCNKQLTGRQSHFHSVRRTPHCMPMATWPCVALTALCTIPIRQLPPSLLQACLSDYTD